MIVAIENDSLIVSLKTKGAELFSIVHKETRLEYMWLGDPAFWGKTSPILFPIVGTLKGDTFVFGDRHYNLTRHGFARDQEFEVVTSDKDQMTFVLKSTPATLQQYPFPFRLDVRYQVTGDFLNVTYTVRNAGDQEMYFSIGGHPAFKVPLVDGTRYEDHYLKFNKIENAPRWPISDDGLVMTNPIAFLGNTDKIYLRKTLFETDALVFKHLHSDVISLKASTHTHGLDFHFEGFPFLGIWAAKNADFVCIEPWCGIADAVTHNQQLILKEGIEKVEAGESWSRTWKAKFF